MVKRCILDVQSFFHCLACDEKTPSPNLCAAIAIAYFQTRRTFDKWIVSSERTWWGSCGTGAAERSMAVHASSWGSMGNGWCCGKQRHAITQVQTPWANYCLSTRCTWEEGRWWSCLWTYVIQGHIFHTCELSLLFGKRYIFTIRKYNITIHSHSHGFHHISS